MCQVSISYKQIDKDRGGGGGCLLLLRVCVSVLEIIFVGQCGVFVCLGFGLFFLYLSPLGREAHRSANGVSIL